MMAHKCREHVVVRHGPSGGHPTYRCKVCEKQVPLRLRANQVLVRRAP